MKKIIDIIVDRLADKVRIDNNVASFAHLLAVVPTAQSGRRLRLALAERFGALVPPVVKTPSGLMYDENDRTIAGRTDELIAFKATGRDYALARQLSDIRAILSAKALSFADVAEALANEMPDESRRWSELADIERQYLAALASRGKRDRIEAMKAWGAKSAAEKWPGVEEIVRLDDPAVFDDFGRMRATVPIERIFPCATPADEAARVAEYFAAVKPHEALPALCVADPELFPEIVSAFRAKGIKIHNPSRTKLSASSLGHLVAQIAALVNSRSYPVFSAFVRGGDVRRWLCAELGLGDGEMTDALIDLDNRQAECLPEKMEDIAPRTEGRLRAIFDFVDASLRQGDVRRLLSAIFRDRRLGIDPESREFAAAADVVNRLLDECEIVPVAGGRLALDMELFAIRLEESEYSLEPDEGDTVVTDGWMELPFLSADELVIAGFREGCVPESVLGHPFLPDSLRVRLDLPGNAAREARDRAILNAAVATRSAGAVAVSYHSISAAGDVLKPSRLLFETPDDADLIARVRSFYGVNAGTRALSARDLPPAWKLKLPVPPRFRRLEKISPTRLDGYLHCPFTYYLRDKSVLGDKRMDDRAEELAAWEYGNLAHAALEAFGNSELRDSVDARVIGDFLETRVDESLAGRFGSAVPAIVAMQGESVKRRLANFAEIQAARREAGWRIVSCERKLEVQYGHTRFHGKCDRIDYREASGEWCVIDYKTWDTAAKAESLNAKTGEWKSLQLPIYCAMLDADGGGEFAAARLDRISACYCVLGKTRDEVSFSAPMNGAHVPDAEAKIRELIARIEAGIFWPPSPAGEWKWDYQDWLDPSPQESVDENWIRDQLERLSAD